jgi:GT2 family glycosyltransferase
MKETLEVTVVTFLRPEQWTLFKSVIDDTLREKQVKKYILALTAEEKHFPTIDIFSKIYKTKLVLLDGGNLTQAELFSATLDEVKKHPSEYVAVLDDTSTPEENWIHNFLNNLLFFTQEEQGKVIMIGNTVDIFGNEQSYYNINNKKYFRDGTLFDIFSFNKIKAFIQHFLPTKKYVHHTPIFRTSAYFGGGVFIPFQAIERAKKPKTSLVMCGVDTEYSWNLLEQGYLFFACAHPVFKRPSSTTRKQSPTLRIFNKNTSDREVYYQTRNAVFISRKHTQQHALTLLCNIITRTILLCAIGAIQAENFSLMFRRISTLLKGTVDGYRMKIS